MILKENKNLLPLILCEKPEHVSIYQKTYEYLHTDISPLEYAYDYTDLIFNRQRTIVTSEQNVRNISLHTLQKKYSLEIKSGQNIDIEKLIGKLTELGYVYNEYGTAGSYKRLGDIIHIVHFRGKREYTLSFWGNVLETIEEILHISDELKTNQKHDTLILGAKKEVSEIAGNDDIFEILNSVGVQVILDGGEFSPLFEKARKTLKDPICFHLIDSVKEENHNLGIFEPKIENVEELKKVLSSGTNYVFTKNQTVIKNFIEFNDIDKTQIFEADISILKSFCTPKVNCICDDILLKVFTKKRIKKSSSRDYDLLLKIHPGDHVVHIDHGVGIYQGIVSKELPTGIGKESMKKEYLELHYLENDKLFVPITEVERITKYVGVDNPELTSLGSGEWERKMAKAGKDIEAIAQELLEIYAHRKVVTGQRLHVDTMKADEFQRDFPHTYTEDQMKCIGEIFEDMGSNKNMDRILIGDVGFGKTEVAFNAMFQAVINKKQCVLISPLVVLAYEHFSKAKERFQNFGVNIAILTRLESEKQAQEVLNGLALGKIDIVIGTHRLLGEKVKYQNLGLIVIDEEHKFGVEDKEKIKKLKANVDCLAMSATPIPRSLNMALAGIRDISTLREPPHGRKDIKTLVLRYEEKVIEEACQREFARGGQVFFIHNKVENIQHIQNVLERIFPEKKVVYTHGKLRGDELEDRIIDFKNRKYDILLSTTVIENGIDFGNVNTIIINECQNFGLSQLHQLRGRVGRTDREGYCYLLYKKEVLPEESIKRLKTIVKYSYLGSGFEIAIKDLEIRGGGDILGTRQSGQATIIGVNLYLEMLEKKIQELRAGGVSHRNTTENISIDLQIPAYIPDSYFNGESDKLNFYREIEAVETLEDVKSILSGFKELNPHLEPEVKNLFAVLQLKIYAKTNKIINVKKVGINYQIDFQKDIHIDELKRFLALDKEIKFQVVSIDKLRAAKKEFKDDADFMQYLLAMLEGKGNMLKVKLKKT